MGTSNKVITVILTLVLTSCLEVKPLSAGSGNEQSSLAEDRLPTSLPESEPEPGPPILPPPEMSDPPIVIPDPIVPENPPDEPAPPVVPPPDDPPSGDDPTPPEDPAPPVPPVNPPSDDTLPPIATPVSGTVFVDNFEYAVSRDVAGAMEIFQSHGWNAVKTHQDNTTRHANGYIYTVDNIPGFSGNFPGRSSNRVLAIEARPFTLQGQTDFYLQFGAGAGPIGQIPANHWYQFWIYSQQYGEQQSKITHGKILYPNRANSYPATTSNNGYVYLSTLEKNQDEGGCIADRSFGCDSGILSTNWNNQFGGINSGVRNQESVFGQNLSSESAVIPNQWTLVKIHVDISGTDPRAAPGQAVYEQWIRRQGSSQWIKTTEWIGGAQINGATVAMTPAFNDGLRTVRIPTTTGATTSAAGDWFDYWLYLDDFTIAGSEAALPVYP